MKSGWQNLIPKIDGVEFINPITYSPQNISADMFVSKDVELVKKSDVIFLYMEKENPTGYGAIWECAVASELNIPIISVWEKDYVDPFIACKSLYLYVNFDAGLKRLIRYLTNN